MTLLRPRVVCLALCFTFTCVAMVTVVSAQEPENAMQPRRPGQGGGRGNIREFLGLGAPPDPVAAKLGEPIYKQNCSTCHGETGRGAQGPNLVRSTSVLHDEKGEEIGPIVKNGRPQSGMPAFPGMKQDEIYNVSQYLHLQVELAANRGTYGQTYNKLRSQTSGDAKKGQAFFQTNCVSCHALTGDFAKIGAKYPQATAMQARFIWPTAPGPKKAVVVTRSGESVSGSLLKLDEFHVSLRDAKGEFHDWNRDQVEVKMEDKLTGHRALLPKYSDSDLHNITAYLVTLK